MTRDESLQPGPPARGCKPPMLSCEVRGAHHSSPSLWLPIPLHPAFLQENLEHPQLFPLSEGQEVTRSWLCAHCLSWLHCFAHAYCLGSCPLWLGHIQPALEDPAYQ